MRTSRRLLTSTSTHSLFPLLSVAMLTTGLLATSSLRSAAATDPTSIVVAYTGGVDTLDPQHTDYGQASFIDGPIYDALVTYSADNKLIGGLASTFTLAPTADSVSVTLRPGVTFHDGSPVTSTDVGYSLDRYVRIGTGVAGLLASYKSTTVIDASHLTINLKGPDALFLHELSRAYIMSAKIVGAHAASDDGQAWLAGHDAGTGPFTLADDTSGANIVANRYAGYWNFSDKRPSSIVFRRIDESATQKAELEAGNIDYANNLSKTDAKALKGSGVTMSNIPVIQQQFIYFNVTTGPTANVKVRRALQMAFDYKGALKSILAGSGAIARGPVPPGMPCEPTFPEYAQNLPKAKALLAQAGYKSLTLTMRYQPDISEQAREAVLFQSDLKKIGVKLNLVPITFSEFLTTLGSKATIPQMMLLADETKIPNVGAFLTQFYGPNSLGQNRSGYSTPEVDTLLTHAASISDPTQQCADYMKAQQVIYEAATAVNLFSVPWPLGYSTKLTGVVVSPTVTPINLATVRLK